MKHLVAYLEKLNPISMQMIRSGVILSCGLLLCSLIIKNMDYFEHSTFETLYSSLFAYHAALAVLAETVGGALLFDHFFKQKKKQNH